MASSQYDNRLERAQAIAIEDVREPLDGVYEIDAINEDGKKRECLTIIPSKRYEATKDLQYRGEAGVVGKYALALAMEVPEVRDQLAAEVDVDLSETDERLRELQERRDNLREAEGHLQDIGIEQEQEDESESLADMFG